MEGRIIGVKYFKVFYLPISVYPIIKSFAISQIILEHACVLLSILPHKNPMSAFLVLFPTPRIRILILVGQSSFAFFFVFLELAFIDIPEFGCESAGTVFHVVQELAFVEIAIRVFLNYFYSPVLLEIL